MSNKVFDELLFTASLLHNNVGAFMLRDGELGDVKNHFSQSVKLQIRSTFHRPQIQQEANAEVALHVAALKQRQRECEVQASSSLQINGSTHPLQNSHDIGSQSSHDIGMYFFSEPCFLDESILHSNRSAPATICIEDAVHKEGLQAEVLMHCSATKYFNMSLLYYKEGEASLAGELLELALGARQTFAQRTQLDVIIHNNLGYIRYEEGEYKQASELFRAARALAYECNEERMLPSILLNMAWAFLRAESALCSTEALNEAQKLVWKRKQNNGETAEQLEQYHMVFSFVRARINHLQGHFSRTYEMYDNLFHSTAKFLGLMHPLVASVLHGMGTVRLDQGKTREARTTLLQALSLRRQIYGDQHASVAQTMHCIGACLKRQGEFSDAITMYEESLRIQQSVLVDSHVDSLRTMCSIAQVHYLQGELRMALSLYERLVDLAMHVYGLEREHKFVANTLLMMRLIRQELSDPFYKLDPHAKAA